MSSLSNILSAVDTYKIHDHLTDINRSYLASQTIMFTDGEIHSSINSDGYITIDSITGEPTYFIYVDTNNKIALDIYKNIPEYKIKDILNYVTMIRKQTGITKNNKKPSSIKNKQSSAANNNIIDINIFKCPKCNNTPKYIEGKHGKILAVCSHCGIEYTFEPSKYYVLTAKCNYIRDNTKYTRNIDITESFDK